MPGKEKNTSSYEAEYSQRLSLLNNAYSLDLSLHASSTIDHAYICKTLGLKVVNWLTTKQIISVKQARPVISIVDSLLVLNESEHRQLAIAIKTKRIRELVEYYNQLQLLKNDRDAQRVLQQLGPNLSLQLRQLTEIENNPEGLPPANTFNVSVPHLPKKLITLTNWSETHNPFSTWSLEGAVCEETLHSGANVFQLTNFASDPELYHLEEVAVKYYVVQTLRALEISESSISQYCSKGVQGFITVWEMFVKKIGEQKARDFFFQGKSSENDFFQLREIIQDCLRKGIVS